MAVTVDRLSRIVIISGISLHKYDAHKKLIYDYVQGAFTKPPVHEDVLKIAEYIDNKDDDMPLVWEFENGTLIGAFFWEDTYYLTGYVMGADQIKLLTYLEVISGILTGNYIFQKDILFHQNVSVDEKESSTQDMLFADANIVNHHTFQDETELLSAVENGDKDTVHEFLEKGFIQTFRRTSPDMMTHYRNVAISSIALASRAAIKGGVPPQMAYDFANTMTKQVDKIPSLSQMYAWICSVFNKYTQMVIDEKDTEVPNGITDQCRQYVIAHYKEKISVKDIADYIGKSPNYVSKVFKESTGMSLTDYINNEKINAAKNILKYSDLDVSAVSNFLSFSSQAYFGKVFKELTGITPKKYKDTNRVKELSFENSIK
ncbi:MAG: AraC family transcriptional regulator [Eubacterium sp.]|nr:AraC family transcriptional regulator [Eubacterium sp.]